MKPLHFKITVAILVFITAAASIRIAYQLEENKQKALDAKIEAFSSNPTFFGNEFIENAWNIFLKNENSDRGGRILDAFKSASSKSPDVAIKVALFYYDKYQDKTHAALAKREMWRFFKHALDADNSVANEYLYKHLKYIYPREFYNYLIESENKYMRTPDAAFNLGEIRTRGFFAKEAPQSKFKTREVEFFTKEFTSLEYVDYRKAAECYENSAGAVGYSDTTYQKFRKIFDAMEEKRLAAEQKERELREARERAEEAARTAEDAKRRAQLEAEKLKTEKKEVHLDSIREEIKEKIQHNNDFSKLMYFLKAGIPNNDVLVNENKKIDTSRIFDTRYSMGLDKHVKAISEKDLIAYVNNKPTENISDEIKNSDFYREYEAALKNMLVWGKKMEEWRMSLSRNPRGRRLVNGKLELFVQGTAAHEIFEKFMLKPEFKRDLNEYLETAKILQKWNPATSTGSQPVWNVKMGISKEEFTEKYGHMTVFYNKKLTVETPHEFSIIENALSVNNGYQKKRELKSTYIVYPKLKRGTNKITIKSAYMSELSMVRCNLDVKINDKTIEYRTYPYTAWPIWSSGSTISFDVMHNRKGDTPDKLELKASIVHEVFKYPKNFDMPDWKSYLGKERLRIEVNGMPLECIRYDD